MSRLLLCWRLSDMDGVQWNPHSLYVVYEEGASWNFFCHTKAWRPMGMWRMSDVLVSSLYRHDKLWFHWVSSVPHSVVRVCVCVCVCAWCLLRMKTNCFHKVKFTHELGFLSDRNCFFVLKICASLAELCISKKHTSSFAQQIIVFLSIQKLG